VFSRSLAQIKTHILVLPVTQTCTQTQTQKNTETNHRHNQRNRHPLISWLGKLALFSLSSAPLFTFSERQSEKESTRATEREGKRGGGGRERVTLSRASSLSPPKAPFSFSVSLARARSLCLFVCLACTRACERVGVCVCGCMRARLCVRARARTRLCSRARTRLCLRERVTKKQ